MSLMSVPVILNYSNMTSNSYPPPITFTFSTTSSSHSDVANMVKLEKQQLCTQLTTQNYAQSTSGYKPSTAFTTSLDLTPTSPSPYYLMGEISNIASLDVRKIIFSVIRAIGKYKLGFTGDDVGPHSNQLSAAMAMCLANVPVLTIMPIYCCSYDAFFIYILWKITSFT